MEEAISEQHPITMKKIALYALMLTGSQLMAGEPVYTVPVQPAPEQDCYTLDMAAVVRFATSDILSGRHSDQINTIGGDLTLGYKLDERDSVNLRFGYGYGSTSSNHHHAHFGHAREKTSLHNFYLMPGYRYTRNVTEKTDIYMGINLGVSNLSVKDSLRHRRHTFRDHDSNWGFAYSAEIGMTHDLTENWSFFAAAEFFGSTARPKIMGRDCKAQNSFGIRAGLSTTF